MRIGIVGVGMVGGTIRHGFQFIGHEVIAHDIKWDTSLASVLDTPLVFICVPTPQAPDGSCDTTLVEEVIEDLYSYRYQGLAVIKSTVTPGTTNHLSRKHGHQLRLAFCPEFLREKTAYTDFIDNHEVCIIGTLSDKDYDLIKQAHGDLPQQFVRLTPLEAEFTKYFSNVYNALRVVFANQFYEVCTALGVDYQKIKRAVSKRGSIGKHYLECNPEFREFGGHCLPKDTSAFAHFVDKLGLGHFKMFRRIVEDNEQIKREREHKALVRAEHE